MKDLIAQNSQNLIKIVVAQSDTSIIKFRNSEIKIAKLKAILENYSNIDINGGRILWLRYINKKSFKEISRELHYHPDNIKKFHRLALININPYLSSIEQLLN